MRVLRARVLIGLPLFISCVALHGAGNEGVFALSLKSLQKPEQVALNQYAHQKLIISYFEPECSWCYRQIKMLEVMHDQCGEKIQPLLIGTHGNRQELQAFLHRTHTHLPAFEASEALLKITGDTGATPLTLIIGAQGEITEKIRGYAPGNTSLKMLCPQVPLDEAILSAYKLGLKNKA
jgi:hypothetical protein